jgi:hypothetical protein
MGNGMSLTAQSKPDLVEAGQQGPDQWGESTVAPQSQKDAKGARFAGGEVQELGRFLAKTCQSSGMPRFHKLYISQTFFKSATEANETGRFTSVMIRILSLKLLPRRETG